MRKWVVILVVAGVVVIAGGWWWFSRKPTYTGPVAYNSTGLVAEDAAMSRVGGDVTENKEVIDEFVQKANVGGFAQISVNYINRMAASDGDVINFWPKSSWGEYGMACGVPEFDKVNNSVKVNFYFTKEYLVKALGDKGAGIEINKYFKYCLLLSLSGKTKEDQEFVNNFKKMDAEYSGKDLLTI